MHCLGMWKAFSFEKKMQMLVECATSDEIVSNPALFAPIVNGCMTAGLFSHMAIQKIFKPEFIDGK